MDSSRMVSLFFKNDNYYWGSCAPLKLGIYLRFNKTTDLCG